MAELEADGYTNIGLGGGFTDIGIWQSRWDWPVMICEKIISKPKLTGTVVSEPKLKANSVTSVPKLIGTIASDPKFKADKVTSESKLKADNIVSEGSG